MTVLLQGGLSADGERVTVRAGDELVAEFPFDAEPYENWKLWLGNQVSGRRQAEREPEFQVKVDEVTRRLADQVDVAGLTRLAAAAVAEDTAAEDTVFIRVELARRELDIVPWELLAPAVASELGNRPVCVYRAARPRAGRVTPPLPPQRALLVDTSPLSMQSVSPAMEQEAIQSRLRGLEQAGLVSLDRCDDADTFKLGAALQRPARAVHVIMHGEDGQVVLRQGDQHVRNMSRAFAQVFRSEPRPAAITLSVCSSVPGTDEEPGVARALAEVGVRQVIGMYSYITPQAALAFFTALYEALGHCADTAGAYAAAVAALRADTYPNHGFWSVPVLYSHDNVIPFPGSFGDPQGAYRRILGKIASLEQELAGLRPEVAWSANTWHAKTMWFCVTADDDRADMAELIELVRPEEKSGSKWAADVIRAARRGIDALSNVVAVAESAAGGGGSVQDFAAGKDALTTALAELHMYLFARQRFAS